MNEIPVIRIEIEGMRQSVQNALAVHNKEFDTMIHKAVDKIFTVETIQAKIDMQVAKALDNAIDSLSESHYIKSVVMDIVLESLAGIRNKLKRKNT